MAKKGSLKKRSRLEAAVATEDLDLDLSDTDERLAHQSTADEDDEDIAHNRKGRKSARQRRHTDDSGSEAEDGMDGIDVLPSDAHRLDGYGDEELGGAGGGSFQEEEELAVATGKTMRKKVTDDDFAVAGVTLGSVKAAASASKRKAAELNAAPVIEAVERDFASLTTSERLAILKKESPELLKMLEDVKRYLAEVKELAKPLHELLYERKVSEADRNLVNFLETKVQLMLSYCMHVTFYLLLKSEGKKVNGHPVIDNLVEIRVYLEKMWPLEEKLQYSLNRLLSGKTAVAAHLDELRPLQGSDSGVYEASRMSGNNEARERRKQQRDQREAEELEKEEQAAMTRVRTKKASTLNALSSTTVAPMSYQEDEDQYFTNMMRGDGDGEDDDDEDGDAGLSLMDALRKRQRQQQQQLATKEADKRRGAADHMDSDVEEGEEELDEEDILALGDDDDAQDAEEDEADYDALWEEEKQREKEQHDRATKPKGRLVVEEVDRRKAGKKIESHRGLTKTRPKDRKTPRVAQRRKYERGLRVQKAQSRTYKPEPEGGFAGVRGLKPGVVRGKSLI